MVANDRPSSRTSDGPLMAMGRSKSPSCRARADVASLRNGRGQPARRQQTQHQSESGEDRAAREQHGQQAGGRRERLGDGQMRIDAGAADEAIDRMHAVKRVESAIVDAAPLTGVDAGSTGFAACDPGGVSVTL